MDLGLRGKIALVAGASRGIGKHIADTLAREGCDVAIVARNADDLEAAREAIAGHGTRVSTLAEDLTSDGAPERVVRNVAATLGAIDILVANTGGSRGEPTSAASDADWDLVLDLNLRVATRLARVVAPAMKERRSGTILTVSSIFGRESGGAVSYNTSKAALIGFTKSLARELIPFGVRVNSLAPGSVLFEGGSWDRRRKAEPERIARFIETELPRGSFGTPQEVAEVAAFLCSDRASLVAGACLNVDGGQSRSLF
jgi:3-oxoacyl-[acyl-carrier protein] reductase